MERIRTAALIQEDERLQFPIIANFAKEVWKTKEVRLSEMEAPLLGDQKKERNIDGGHDGSVCAPCRS